MKEIIQSIQKEFDSISREILSVDEMAQIAKSIIEYQAGRIKNIPGVGSFVKMELEELWSLESFPNQAQKHSSIGVRKSECIDIKNVRYSRRIVEPAWYLNMTDDFIKTTKKIDRKLQGRIFEALGVIVKAPDQPLGNTVKPLTGDLQGMWRYRIGDYRLIYRPNKESGQIYLLSFSSRGEAYS